MSLAKRVVATLSVLALMAAPLFADIIPPSYESKSDARVKVQSQLTELGLKSENAKLRTQGMTSDEAAYFAGNVDRIQVSGQELWAGQTDMMWYEWIGGVIALGGTIGGIIYFAGEQ